MTTSFGGLEKARAGEPPRPSCHERTFENPGAVIIGSASLVAPMANGMKPLGASLKERWEYGTVSLVIRPWYFCGTSRTNDE